MCKSTTCSIKYRSFEILGHKDKVTFEVKINRLIENLLDIFTKVIFMKQIHPSQKKKKGVQVNGSNLNDIN